MSSNSGVIALMGSGELTATMVETHKALLANLGTHPRAVFLDTPAGFQLNVDQISGKAVAYFATHVKYPISVASFKSSDSCTPYEAEQAFHCLREADFILIGPGSPTYAVCQWQQTPVPEIISRRIEDGGCLVAASAAALTVGRFTLPVYEIYKVGDDLHWVEGMNILGHFGFNLVVIPHWNNAEGGTHDTRFCYMGEPRFRKLESLLPEDVSILGLDEHTACIIDLEKNEAVVRGIGSVTLRRHGTELIFETGERFSLEVLRGGDVAEHRRQQDSESPYPVSVTDIPAESFWDRVHTLEAVFHAGLEKHAMKETASALLELDKAIWKAHMDSESSECISQARDIFRDMIVLLANRLESSPKNKAECLAPLVAELLALRENFRHNRQWKEADAIRDTLQRVHMIIEDTGSGSQWRLKS